MVLCSSEPKNRIINDHGTITLRCSSGTHTLAVTNSSLIAFDEKNIMSGFENLANSPALMKSWILEENLQQLLY